MLTLRATWGKAQREMQRNLIAASPVSAGVQASLSIHKKFNASKLMSGLALAHPVLWGLKVILLYQIKSHFD